MWNWTEENERGFGVELPEAFEIVQKSFLEWNARWHIQWRSVTYDQTVASLRYETNYTGTGHAKIGQKMQAFLNNAPGIELGTYNDEQTRITLVIQLTPYVVSGVQHPPSVTVKLTFHIQTGVPQGVNYLDTIVSQTVACIFYYLEHRELQLMPPEHKPSVQDVRTDQGLLSNPIWQRMAASSSTSKTETRTEYRARLAAMTPEEREKERQVSAIAYAKVLADNIRSGKVPDYKAERQKIINDPLARAGKIKEFEQSLRSGAILKRKYMAEHGKKEEGEKFFKQAETEIASRAIKMVRLWYDEDNSAEALKVLHEWKTPEPTPAEIHKAAADKIVSNAKHKADLLKLSGDNGGAEKFLNSVYEKLPKLAKEYYHRKYEEKDGAWAEELVQEFDASPAEVHQLISKAFQHRYELKRRALIDAGDEIAAEQLRVKFRRSGLDDATAKLAELWLTHPFSWDLSLDKLCEIWIDGKQNEFEELCALREKKSSWESEEAAKLEEFYNQLRSLGYKPDWLMDESEEKRLKQRDDVLTAALQIELPEGRKISPVLNSDYTYANLQEAFNLHKKGSLKLTNEQLQAIEQMQQWSDETRQHYGLPKLTAEKKSSKSSSTTTRKKNS